MKHSDSARSPVMMQQSIKVFNADGTLKHDYGMVNYWHRNPLKRWAWSIKQWFKRLGGKARASWNGMLAAFCDMD